MLLPVQATPLPAPTLLCAPLPRHRAASRRSAALVARAAAPPSMADLVAELAEASPARDALVDDAVVWACQHGLVRNLPSP